jgi:pimeloyl-ACP methyl ester carboxylesterase
MGYFTINTNPSERTLQLLDGRNLGYVEYGRPDGQLLFYFHGWPSARVEARSTVGDEIAARLGVRLVAVDRPGTGLSTFLPGRRFIDWPRDICALANHLNVGRFSIMSYSAGSPYALACAALIPDRLEAVGVVSGVGQPFSAPGATKGMPTIFLWTTARIHPRLTALLFNMMRNTLANASSAPLPASAKQAMMAEVDFEFVKQHPEVIAGNMAGGLEAIRQGGYGPAYDASLYWKPWGFRLTDIRIPVRVWHGEDDLNAPCEAHGRHLARAIPNARAQFYPGEGHISLIHKYAEEFISQLIGR